MSELNLPEPIAAYFEADRARQRSRRALLHRPMGWSWTRDEHTRVSQAIKAWKTAASAKYSYIAEPFALVKQDRKYIVTSRVTGDFPGSPVDLAVRLHARARQDRIVGDHAMSFDLQLAGMRALVTGGARGVGAAVVQALVEADARVVAVARSLPSDRSRRCAISPRISRLPKARRMRQSRCTSSSAASTSSSTWSVVRLRQPAGSQRSMIRSGRKSWTRTSCPPSVWIALCCLR